MSGKRIEINPGEFFMIADRTILVEEHESVLGDLFKIGSSNHEPAYLFTFKGKINHKDESDSVTVAMNLQGAWELCGNILNGLELFKKANGG